MKSLDTVGAWRDYFNDVGIADDLVQNYTALAGAQLRAKVPVVLDVEHLARLLGVSDKYFNSACFATPNHYRYFEIPKRRGGSRHIASPRSALKSVQRWILNNILNGMPVHDSAFGFCSGRSILDHACRHNSSKFILKIDVKDFFPSIKLPRVIGIFKSFGYSPGVAHAFGALCCLEGGLPQGAVTSPALSNLVCRRLDKRFSGLAIRSGLKYSRYADDIAFSGEKLSISTTAIVEKILLDEGFELRSEKTRFYGEVGKRVLTGLNSVPSGVRILKSDRREMRAAFHQIRKFGVRGYVSSNKIRDPLFLERLIGKFSFWLFVEPDDKFAAEAIGYLLRQKRSLSTNF